ncbi:acetoacetate decarboxylase family protein [Endozoicomonas arenosclerae]|uniref:acetoacetate decarboxylase family protein n=1 Tax=Endozoicomonas arenosclerae TaxID=1633495 RepID=UPI0007819853|nr:acetoacetate decarboxylase family protein [Endozoicomonas arenosclerae]
MSSEQQVPQTNPGEIINWPLLKIKYDTDPACIEKLLPPGITPGKNPTVNITVYNFPVLNEPEYGYVISVDADHDGITGEFTLAIGIDQEAAVFGSQERWGQPKFPATTQYFRMMDQVTAKLTHQGYTFLEFSGKVTGTGEIPPEHETNEWWLKYSRSVDVMSTEFDYPPHVVRVYSKYGTAHIEELECELKLNESPWDPIATLLPVKSKPKAHLWTPVFLDRRITLAGKLDAEAFFPYADTIGGSRWPGESGGPKKTLYKE